MTNNSNRRVLAIALLGGLLRELSPARYPTAPAAACDINEQWLFLMQ